MLSFIKCVGCPKVCAPNTPNIFKFRIYHLGLSRKILFHKIYIGDELYHSDREESFIFFIKIKRLSYGLVFDNEGKEIIKVEVGYEEDN